MDDLIVVEFSVLQQAFHSHDVASMVRHNWDACVEGRPDSDWLPIGVFKTDKAAYAFIRKVEPILRGEK